MRARILYIISLLSISCGLYAQDSFVTGGFKYTVIDPTAHTLEVASAGKKGVSLTHAHGNAIQEVRIHGDVEHDGVKYKVVGIADSAFINHGGIDRVRIDNGVEYVGAHAFQGCNHLEELAIPATITSLSNVAFSGCVMLRKISVSGDNTMYDSRGDCNAIIETATNTLTLGCATTRIPADIKTIGDFAFSGVTSLASLELPDGLTEIGAYAFSGCMNLKQVKLPVSLRTIGDGAFAHTGLTEIFIPDSVSSIAPVLESPFAGCVSLKSITVAKENPYYDSRKGCNAVIETGRRRLVAGCQTTKIPEGVREIAGYAFSGQTGLNQIFIPRSVERIYGWAFYGCINLVSIVVDKNNHVYDSRENCNAIIKTADNTLTIGCGNTIIPNNVTAIESWAFYWMNTPETLRLPQSVKSVGTGAFANCGNLKTLYIEQRDCVLGRECFAECKSLREVELPDGIHEIPHGLFKNCYELQSIYIPFGCKIIGGEAFSGCINLENVEIGNTVSVIEKDAFKNCPVEHDIQGLSAIRN